MTEDSLSFELTNSERRIAHVLTFWGIAIAKVPCLTDTFVQGGSSVLRMKCSAKTPYHRKSKKCY